MAKLKTDYPREILRYINHPSRESTRDRHRKQLREEYTKQRDIAQKRIKRALAKGETLEDIRAPWSEVPKLREMKNDRDLARELSLLTRWNKSKYSTSKGRKAIRQKTAETMQKLGYEGVSEDNVNLFNRFMEQMRRRYEEDTPEGKVRFIGSDMLVEAFDALRERGKINEESNSSSIGRAFNDYLRETGNEDLISKPKKRRKKKK